ncbi:uncharacterized protein LOC125755353 isoform X7 [Canis lupus dingo]|uniref:uncharacterized protein LOC125755353 isoform X7 n=1 Tax=Canis lupus dingo TaxID=286419 RepID=UPI0020C38B88|nr:uncharacterized protein LOC125755353 isoform X7 [Canis lupus dingo]
MKRATDDMQTECEKERKTTIVSSLSASGKSSCQHSFHTQPQKIICDMVKGSRFGGRQIFLLNFCNLRHLTISQHHKKKVSGVQYSDSTLPCISWCSSQVSPILPPTSSLTFKFWQFEVWRLSEIVNITILQRQAKLIRK